MARQIVSLRRCAPSWEEAVEEFMLVKRSEGRAAETLRGYAKALKAFFADHYAAWPDAAKLKVAAREHFARLSNFSASHYNVSRAYLRVFFNWCVAEGYITHNPLEGLPARREKAQPRVVREDVLKALLELPDRRTYCGARDYALLLFQLDTGTRPAEALALTPDCFDLSHLEVRIPAHVSKTRRERVVVISPEVARAVRKLLSLRPREWDAGAPVFASENGQQMLETSWARRLQRYSKQLGVRVTPYSLRHSAATLALRNGASSFHVKQQLGHCCMSTTARYVHLVEEDLHQAHQVASPVANLLREKKRAPRKRATGHV